MSEIKCNECNRKGHVQMGDSAHVVSCETCKGLGYIENNDILTGKWIFSVADLTATDPSGTTHQLEILGWKALRSEIAAVSTTRGEHCRHYWVTERSIKVQEFRTLRELPAPTPEQAARCRELADWIPTVGNPLRDNRNYEEL